MGGEGLSPYLHVLTAGILEGQSILSHHLELEIMWELLETSEDCSQSLAQRIFLSESQNSCENSWEF